MAILYYPKDSVIARVNAWNPNYEQTVIGVNPNMVFYFDTGSGINAASASLLAITSSWAQTASVSITFASNSLSASYAATASVALNALGGSGIVTASTYPITSSFALNLSPTFTTIFTSSTNWITVSLDMPEQYVTITNANVQYSFTHSSAPANPQVAYTTLFINNLTTGAGSTTASLSFPSSWIFMGNVPQSLTASKAAMLTLKGYGTSSVVAGFAVQY